MPAELRRATAGDAAAITAVTVAGFATYHAFAGPGWRPPLETVDATRQRLTADDAWGVVAVSDGEIVGIGAFEPARDGRAGPPVEGMGHIWAIFVSEPHWGDGTAVALLAATTAEMTARGYRHGRLYTPAAHARARRFYTREGWIERPGVLGAPELGLDMVDLRRVL
jgi:GNAT superfamily N-acetyltransferase